MTDAARAERDRCSRLFEELHAYSLKTGDTQEYRKVTATIVALNKITKRDGGISWASLQRLISTIERAHKRMKAKYSSEGHTLH